MPPARAVCTKCRKPLADSLMAASCNHVFHKQCLLELQAEAPVWCPACQKPLLPKDSQDLFGVKFEKAFTEALEAAGRRAATYIQKDLEATWDPVACVDSESESEDAADTADPDKPKKDTKKPIDLDPEDSGDDALGQQATATSRAEMLEEVAELCAWNERNRELRRRLESLESEAAKEEKKVRSEQTKRDAAEARRRSIAERKATAEKELREVNAERLLLQERLDSSREQDAIFTYLEELKQNGPERALQSLNRMAKLLNTPGTLLADLARLRNECRNQQADRAKKSKELLREESSLKDEIEELQRRCSLKRAKLERLRSRNTTSDPLVP